MMAALKAYTLGNYGFVRPDVIAAIGCQPHIRQADVFVVAASKVAAMAVLEQVGMCAPSRSDPGFRVDDGSSTREALARAGLLREPAVFVSAMTGTLSSNNAVVRLAEGGSYTVVGTLRRAGFELVLDQTTA